MIKKGDIFTAYREGYPTKNVLALMDYEKGLLLFCTDSNGCTMHVTKDEIGEVLGNIDKM